MVDYNLSKPTIDSIVSDLPNPLESLTATSAVDYVTSAMADYTRDIIGGNEEFSADFYDSFLNIAMTYARRIDDIGVGRITKSILNPLSWLPKIGFHKIRSEYQHAIESFIEHRLDLYNQGTYERSVEATTQVDEDAVDPPLKTDIVESVSDVKQDTELPKLPRLGLSLD